MTIQNNNYITSIMSELQTISTQSGIDKNGYTNSIFGAGYGVINIAQGGHAQKVSGIQQTINSLTSLLSKLISNEASEAKKEVDKSSKKAQDTEDKAKATRKELNTELSKLESDIKNQNTIVSNMTSKVEEKQKELDSKQKEVNKVIEEINNKQEELKKETDPKEQARLLEEIGELSKGLNTHIDAITTMRSDIAELSTAIENCYKEIETAKGNQVTIQQKGEAELSQLAQESVQNAGDVAETAATGVKNQYVAAEATAAAEAASSNAVTASGAVKLYRVAADQESAGTTRIAGAQNTFNTVKQGIGSLKNCSNLLQKFDTSIGGALNTFSNLVVGWNDTIEPMITSLGSWSEFEKSKETLDNAVEEDKKVVKNSKPGEDSKPVEDNKPAENNKPVENDNKPKATDAANNLKTPTVEIKLFEVK